MNNDHLPTPETDAFEKIIPSRLTPDEFDQNEGEWVPVRHARSLEQRLTAARMALLVIRTTSGNWRTVKLAADALKDTQPPP